MESIRELYRIGHGPSSSHTMAPRKAAQMFRERYPDAARFEVTLYGSLASTGKGHFTDRALADTLAPAPVDILWQPDEQLPRHPNGMQFRAFSAAGTPSEPWQVYSQGGGALSFDALGAAEASPRCSPSGGPAGARPGDRGRAASRGAGSTEHAQDRPARTGAHRRRRAGCQSGASGKTRHGRTGDGAGARCAFQQQALRARRRAACPAVVYSGCQNLDTKRAGIKVE